MANRHAVLAITRGLPGEGKSTWAAEGVAQGWQVVSLDGIRAWLYGDASTQGDIVQVLNVAESQVAGAILAGRRVIFDATSVVWEHVTPWITLAERLHVPWVIVEWPGDVAASKAAQVWRQQQGQRWVPDEVIERMAALWPTFPPLPYGYVVAPSDWEWPLGPSLASLCRES